MAKKPNNINHIGRLVRNIYIAVTDESHKVLRQEGYSDLDGSYSIIFQHIGTGARATDIAVKARTSKQNVKYLLEVLEKKGLVRRKQDAKDGRAWIFELTGKGHDYRNAGLRVIAALEKKWAEAIGETRYFQLIKNLEVLNTYIIEQNGTA
ncbi:MAG: MarR family transcriptional regulator [Chitinophagales bacterium]|nr:MarR family transcriptional regulator [Chitinophagales bacterium]